MATPATGSVGVLTTKGDILVHDGTDVERLAAGASGTALVADPTTPTGLKYTAGPPFAPTAQTDVLCPPMTPGLGAQSIRADQVLLEGGMYQLIQPAIADRFVFRVTALAGAPTTTIAMGLYQAPGGGEGVANKLASVAAFAPAAVGNQEAAFAEGVVSIEQGVFYLLVGRRSAGGSYSLRTYTIQPYDLMNQNMQPLYPRPVTFLTALSSAVALPATFDPRISPTGAAIETSLNIIPVLRLRKT